MSLLNFIAGGLGAGGRPNQKRSQPIQCLTSLNSGLSIEYLSPTQSPNQSPTLSYISKASTIQPTSTPPLAYSSSAQDFRYKEYSSYMDYYRNLTTPNTPMAISRQDPILHAFNSFFANPYNPPSTTISGRDFAYQKLQNRELNSGNYII